VATLRHTMDVDAPATLAHRAWRRAAEGRGTTLVEELPGWRLGWAAGDSRVTVGLEPLGERSSRATVVVDDPDPERGGKRLRETLEAFAPALDDARAADGAADETTPDPAGAGMRGKLSGAEPGEAEERWPGPTPPEAGAPVAPDNRPAGPHPRA
jgi:hypothetical protein